MCPNSHLRLSCLRNNFFKKNIETLLVPDCSEFLLVEVFHLFNCLELGHDLLEMTSALSRSSSLQMLTESFKNPGSSKCHKVYFLFSLEVKILL